MRALAVNPTASYGPALRDGVSGVAGRTDLRRQDCITAGDPRARQMSCFPPRTLLRSGCRTMARTSGHRPQIYRKPRAELVPADNATSALLGTPTSTSSPSNRTIEVLYREAATRNTVVRSPVARGAAEALLPAKRGSPRRGLDDETQETVIGTVEHGARPGVSAHERRRSSPHVGQRLEIDAGLGVLTTMLGVLILVWPGRSGAAWPPATTNSPSPTGQLQSWPQSAPGYGI